MKARSSMKRSGMKSRTLPARFGVVGFKCLAKFNDLASRPVKHVFNALRQAFLVFS